MGVFVGVLVPVGKDVVEISVMGFALALCPA